MAANHTALAGMKRLLSRLRRHKPALPATSSITTPPITSASLVEVTNGTDSPLESLPFEIRHCILSMLELPQLKSLVRASPVFHQQYLLARGRLLLQCLETTLADSVADAFLVFRTGTVDFLDSRTTEGAIAYSKTLGDGAYSANFSIHDEDIPLKQAIYMVEFHFSVITPLVQHYAEWALTDLAQEASREEPDSEPLSHTETIRLSRGFYRHQLCSNLFGLSTYTGLHRRRDKDTNGFCKFPLHYFDDTELARHLTYYEPWEVEEIFAVHEFLSIQLEGILDLVVDDVDRQHRRFIRRYKDGAFIFDDPALRQEFAEVSASRGPAFVQTCLSIKDHEVLVSLIEQQISHRHIWFLQPMICRPTDQERMILHEPTERDYRQDRRDPLPFRGDSHLLPPLSWTLMWEDTYSNVYGGWIDRDTRRWGYIMWDADRLERSGGKEVLLRQWWRLYCVGDDRREFVFIDIPES